MPITKTILRKTAKPYAPSMIEMDGRKVLLVAPVDHGECYAFFPPYTDGGQALWSDSGTMTILPMPDEQNTFLATRSFFSGFKAENAHVIRVRYDASAQDPWRAERVFSMPYLHRFNIITAGGRRFLLGCTLCRHKRFTDDWSTPGAVFAVDITDGWHAAPEPTYVITDIFKNHGYFHTTLNGIPTSFATGAEGVFRIRMDSAIPSEWVVDRILDRETSDIVSYDIDGDGVDELLTVEGFHGDAVNVYKQTEDDTLRTMFTLHAPQGHALWGGCLGGERSFLVGHCSGESNLLLLRMGENGSFDMTVETIDRQVGPRNITVYRDDGTDFILSSNWGVGEIALYAIGNSSQPGPA